MIALVVSGNACENRSGRSANLTPMAVSVPGLFVVLCSGIGCYFKYSRPL